MNKKHTLHALHKVRLYVPNTEQMYYEDILQLSKTKFLYRQHTEEECSCKNYQILYSKIY